MLLSAQIERLICWIEMYVQFQTLITALFITSGIVSSQSSHTSRDNCHLLIASRPMEVSENLPVDCTAANDLGLKGETNDESSPWNHADASNPGPQLPCRAFAFAFLLLVGGVPLLPAVKILRDSSGSLQFNSTCTIENATLEMM